MIGLGLALGLRLALLATLVFIVGLTKPVLTLLGHAFSWRDLISPGRRPVPGVEGHARDPPERRGRRGRGA